MSHGNGKERIALFMCAAHCQGGHSATGKSAADALGITFPVTMKKLVNQARKEGFDPKKLWPWLYHQDGTEGTAE